MPEEAAEDTSQIHEQDLKQEPEPIKLDQNAGQNTARHRARLSPKNAESLEDSFRIPWKDQKGHSEKDWLRVQPLVLLSIEEIVQSRQFPFRSRGDIYRVGINNLLNQLQALGWESSILAQAKAIQRITIEEGYYREFYESMQGVEDEVVRLRGRGYVAEAQGYLERIKREIEVMPVGLWKDRYQEKLAAIERGN